MPFFTILVQRRRVRRGENFYSNHVIILSNQIHIYTKDINRLPSETSVNIYERRYVK